MKYISRGYQSKNDLYEIRKLIRRAYARSQPLNAWSFCRFDIWAQRRIADSESFDDSGWQKHVQLWLDDASTLIGAAFGFDDHHFRKNPNPQAIILDPDHLQITEAMLDWMEAQAAPHLEVKEGNTFLRDLVRARGYSRSDDAMIVREKTLTGTSLEAVNLPSGYQIKILRRADWIPYFVAVNAVFNMMDTVDAFRSIQQAPSNIPELHLNVVNEHNEIAAFCSVWLDQENKLAEFEPVGTVPRFQKLGLGSALLAYACNRLREMQVPLVRVESWSESPGANKLYSNCGMNEKDRIHTWKMG